MKSSKPSPTIHVRTNTRAGGKRLNHGARVRQPETSDKLTVRTGVRAGGTFLQHGVRVRQPCGPRS